MSETMSSPRLGVELFAPDPYVGYRALRDCGPIHWSDDLFGGAWVLTTFDGVAAALKDTRLSARRTGGWVMSGTERGSDHRHQLADMQRLFGRAMLFADNPAHLRLRQELREGFSPAAIQNLRPFVEQTISNLLAEIDVQHQGHAPFDFVDTFANILPARIITHFLGLRLTNEAELLNWSASVSDFLGDAQPDTTAALAARESILAMRDYITTSLDQGEFDEDGLVSKLLRAEQAGDIQSDDEMISQCVMLLFAGLETTRYFLGTAVYWLLEDPKRWTALRHTKNMRTAVCELLRYDSPVQYTGRRANCAFNLMGRDIKRNDLVLALIGSANRDPQRYENPDQIAFDRRVGMPLSFGTGPHMCIGAALTILEAECALKALIERWPDARLAEDRISWINKPLYRGPSRLMIFRH